MLAWRQVQRRAGAIERIDGAQGLAGVAATFELGADELHIDRTVDRVAIVGRHSAAQFAAFADKVAALIQSEPQSGHHYLDWHGMTDIQIVVSKNEYPADFGTESATRTP